jgi:hypothetical protein
MARESREVWAKRIDRWRASGLTAEEFASEIGVKGSTLRHWSWVLGRERRGSGDERGRRARPREVAFVEVATPSPLPACVEPLELVVRDGIRIRVPAAFDADALRRVIAAVEGR